MEVNTSAHGAHEFKHANKNGALKWLISWKWDAFTSSVTAFYLIRL